MWRAALLEKAFLSAGAKQETLLTLPEPWGPPREPGNGCAQAVRYFALSLETWFCVVGKEGILSPKKRPSSVLHLSLFVLIRWVP